DRLDGLVMSSPAVVAQVTQRSESDVRRFQEAASRMVILSHYLRQQAPDAHEFQPTDTSFYRNVFRPAMQAMDSATTAEGIEYVPRSLSGTVIERIQLELVVASLFQMVE